MQMMANRAGVTILANPQDIQIYLDCDRIIQVLTNLLGNAIKFSPRGSTVWLNVKLEAEGIVLFEVKDQGRGIPAKNLDSIFERFHQVDASDSRKFERFSTGGIEIE